LLENKPCIVTVIIFVIIPLLTGNVLFDVQGVQAEHAAGVPTVFQTNSVNPQVTTTGIHMPYHWSPTTATTFSGIPMPSSYGTANTANTNNKGVSSTTTTHNTANNDAVFGAFFQTAGKTTSTAKTNNADLAKRTATTSTRDADPASTSTADPASTTTSRVADPAVSPGAQRVTGVVIGGSGGSLARTILVDLSAQAATIRATTGETSAAALLAAANRVGMTQVSIAELLLSVGTIIVILALSILLYITTSMNQLPNCLPSPPFPSCVG
jgi:hypothetical protein